MWTRNILIAFGSAGLTVACWSSDIFYPGMALILLPLMLLLNLVGLSVLFIFPFIIYKLIKKQAIHARVFWLLFVSIGFIIGNAAQKPIDNWDEVQRNRSGRLITEELEIYKLKNGSYPSNLTHLDTLNLNSTLPRTYPINRFNYQVTNQEYHLDIPIFLDRWHWEMEKQVFVYSDF